MQVTKDRATLSYKLIGLIMSDNISSWSSSFLSKWCANSWQCKEWRVQDFLGAGGTSTQKLFGQLFPEKYVKMKVIGLW